MPEVVWEQSGCQLVHGDGPEVLAGLRDVRAVITDPPYGCLTRPDISKPRQRRTGHGGRIRRSATWEVCGEELDSLLARTLQAASLALSDGWLHVFCSDRYLSRLIELADQTPGLSYRCPHAFCKTNPAPRVRSAQWQSAVELAAVIAAGRPPFEGNHANHWRGPFEAASRRWHETQKQIRLLEHLVERYTRPGELVADPFAGSGQIIRACLATGRRCVAVELDEEICETARRAYSEGLPAARRLYAERGGLVARSSEGQLALPEAAGEPSRGVDEEATV